MSGNSLAMMPWFPRDFIASTRAMRLAERGAYRDLLDYQWEMGKLPSDHERLARLLGCSRAEFDDVWPAIADKFVRIGVQLVNQRLEEHRKKALESRERKVKAARETNAKRYGERAESDTDSDSLSDAMSESPSGSPPSPSPSDESLLLTLSQPEPYQARDKSRAAVAKQPVQRGTRIPEPFEITVEMHTWAFTKAPDVDLKEATDEFVDYWRGIPGQRGLKLDWPGTWRNRMRTVQAAKRRPPALNGKRSGVHTGSSEGIVTHAEREAAELRKLMDRREGLRIGDFRNPRPGETADQYRKAQNDEHDRRREATVDKQRQKGAA